MNRLEITVIAVDGIGLRFECQEAVVHVESAQTAEVEFALAFKSCGDLADGAANQVECLMIVDALAATDRTGQQPVVVAQLGIERQVAVRG